MMGVFALKYLLSCAFLTVDMLFLLLKFNGALSHNSKVFLFLVFPNGQQLVQRAGSFQGMAESFWILNGPVGMLCESLPQSEWFF